MFANSYLSISFISIFCITVRVCRNHSAAECVDCHLFLSSFIDINECAENTLLCGSEARCINKPATYECVCEKGFSLNKPNMKCFGE